MDYQKRIDDRLLHRVRPTGLDDPRAGANGQSGMGGTPDVASYLYLPWYALGWQYRTLITVPRGATSADLTNYAVYVNGTGMPASLWTAAQADGDDLLVTAEDGVTKIAHDLPHFVPGSSAMELHILADTLQALHDKRFWLYYGNPTAADQRNPAGVWATNYLAVYHLGEATGNYADSTGNGYTAIPNLITMAQSGPLFATGAARYNTSGNYIDITGADVAVGLSGLSAVTFEGWFNRANVTAGPYLLDINMAGPLDKFSCRVWASAGSVRLICQPKLSDTARTSTSTEQTFGVGWHHLAMSVNISGETVAAWLDGAALTMGAPGAWTETAFSNEGGIANRIGSTSTGGNAYLGYVDEARIRESYGTLAWYATQYANHNSPGTFYTVGPTMTRIVPALLTDTAGNGLDQGYLL